MAKSVMCLSPADKLVKCGLKILRESMAESGNLPFNSLSKGDKHMADSAIAYPDCLNTVSLVERHQQMWGPLHKTTAGSAAMCAVFQLLCDLGSKGV